MLEEPFQRKARDSTALQNELNDNMALPLISNGVSEIYSPPRVVRFVEEFNLVGGWSFDLAIVDEGGEAWAFQRRNAR